MIEQQAKGMVYPAHGTHCFLKLVLQGIEWIPAIEVVIHYLCRLPAMRLSLSPRKSSAQGLSFLGQRCLGFLYIGHTCFHFCLAFASSAASH
jgi:hypothetical protein